MVRSLGLRWRVTLTFAVLSLSVAAIVSGATYAVANWYLSGQRTDAAITRASLDARSVAASLRSGVAPGEALAQLPVTDGSQPMLRIGEQWFTSTVGVPPDALPPLLLEQAAAQGAQQRVSIGGDPYLVIAMPLDASLFVEVFPLRALDATLTFGGWGLVAVTLLAGASGAVLGWYAARRLLVPVDQLGAGALALAEGDLQTRLPDSGDPDLDPIAQAFNEMAEAVQARIAREQRFAANVSHELRSPMTAISGVTDLLEDRSPQMAPQDAQIVDHLARQVRRLSRMLVDLLEISRMGANEHIETEPVDVRALAAQVVRAQGLSDDIVIGPPAVVSTDARHLERVYDNIVRNAQTHGEGLRAVSVADEGDRVVLHFDDAGPGVEPELAQRIFEPFVRGEGADPTSGAGLGMAIALEHAQAITATVAIGQSPLGGTRVTVLVPRSVTS
jgi:two-component system, OmpR family, sensor histidine kinase MtrB